MKPAICYYRVSTVKQGVSGLGLEAQKEAVHRFTNTRDYTIVHEFTEVQSSNRKKNKERPLLKEALKLCKESNAALIVYKLDRLERNVRATAELIESGIEFICVDNPNINKFTLQILSCVAEKELEDISQRTKAALGALKAKGVKLGPKYKPLTAEVSAPYREQWNRQRKESAYQFADRIHPVIQYHLSKGCNYSQVAEELNTRKYSTPSGKGRWSCTTVKRCVSVIEKGAL